MDAVAQVCACATHPIDWVLRSIAVFVAFLGILSYFDERRTRLKPETIQAVTDQVERQFGAEAISLAHTRLLQMMEARYAEHYDLLRAVAAELRRRDVERLHKNRTDRPPDPSEA